MRMSVVDSSLTSGRPRRAGAAQHQVVYRECDSDDEDYETVLLLKSLLEGKKQAAEAKKVAEAKMVAPTKPLPPLSALQLELKQICRLGDKEALKTFLANNPEINLDFKDPQGTEHIKHHF